MASRIRWGRIFTPKTYRIYYECVYVFVRRRCECFKTTRPGEFFRHPDCRLPCSKFLRNLCGGSLKEYCASRRTKWTRVALRCVQFAVAKLFWRGCVLANILFWGRGGIERCISLPHEKKINFFSAMRNIFWKYFCSAEIERVNSEREHASVKNFWKKIFSLMER